MEALMIVRDIYISHSGKVEHNSHVLQDSNNWQSFKSSHKDSKNRTLHCVIALKFHHTPEASTTLLKASYMSVVNINSIVAKSISVFFLFQLS